MEKQKESAIAILIAGIVAFLYISGIPATFFLQVELADVDPVCITLLVNIVIAMAIGVGLQKWLIPNFEIGFTGKKLTGSLRKYGGSCLITLVVPGVAFGIGLYPFDYQPTVWKVLIEGLVYYVGVGLIEESFCRGLLQKAIEQLLGGRKNAQLNAVVAASVIFGLGHIFGMIGMPVLLASCKIIWAVGLGIYLGAIYAKTGNLWVAAGFHCVIDWCGLPFCFTTQSAYPTVSAIVVLITFLLLGAYGIGLLKKEA